MTPMLGFLTVVLWATVACSNITPMTDFSLDGMKGKWYVIGIATNAKWFNSHKASMKMGVIQIEPTDDGDLEITFSYSKNGSCWEKSCLAKKTETPGCFFHHSDHWGNDNNLCVTDAKFDEFAIWHVTKTKEGQSSVLTKLYGRDKHLSKDVQEKFQRFSVDNGIETENIVFLPEDGACIDEEAPGN